MGLTAFNRMRRTLASKKAVSSSVSESKVEKTVDAVKPEEKKPEGLAESTPKKGKKTNSEPLV